MRFQPMIMSDSTSAIGADGILLGLNTEAGTSSFSRKSKGES
jgi:hypothetical protein